MASALTSGAMGGAKVPTRRFARPRGAGRNAEVGVGSALTSRRRAPGAVAELAATGWEAGNCLPCRLARLLELNYHAVEPGFFHC